MLHFICASHSVYSSVEDCNNIVCFKVDVNGTVRVQYRQHKLAHANDEGSGMDDSILFRERSHFGDVGNKNGHIFFHIRPLDPPGKFGNCASFRLLKGPSSHSEVPLGIIKEMQVLILFIVKRNAPRISLPPQLGLALLLPVNEGICRSSPICAPTQGMSIHEDVSRQLPCLILPRRVHNVQTYLVSSRIR